MSGTATQSGQSVGGQPGRGIADRRRRQLEQATRDPDPLHDEPGPDPLNEPGELSHTRVGTSGSHLDALPDPEIAERVQGSVDAGPVHAHASSQRPDVLDVHSQVAPVLGEDL
jgi:hypothetical protein